MFWNHRRVPTAAWMYQWKARWFNKKSPGLLRAVMTVYAIVEGEQRKLRKAVLLR